jgi:hypothetical protein
MARHYVIQDWSNSATWSGEMIGDRLSKSKGHHFLRNGQANVELYAGDEEEELRKKSRIALKDRILPQFKRLNVLTDQILELEAEYKSGHISLSDYSVLRDVLFSKKERAEILYKKAVSVKPKSSQLDDEYQEDGVVSSVKNAFSSQPNDEYASEEYEEIGVVWIDELSDGNSLKGVLKFSCKAIRKAVQFSQATRNYIKTLSEV